MANTFRRHALERLGSKLDEGELEIASKYARHALAIASPSAGGSPPTETSYYVLAFDILRLRDELRAFVLEVVWTPDLASAVLAEISRRSRFWTLALVSLGNSSATCDARFCLRILAAAVPKEAEVGGGILLAPYLASILSDCPQECSQPCSGTGTPVGDSILWVFANLATQGGAEKMRELAPVLVDIIHTDAASSATLSSASQMTMRSFRALVAILSADKGWWQEPSEEEGSHVFDVVHAILTKYPGIMGSLVEEYKCGLEGRALAGKNFLPDAHDRAMTCSQLSMSHRGRAVLHQFNVTPLLVRSIHAKSQRGMATSSRLWAHSVQAIHRFTLSLDGRRLLVNSVGEGLESLRRGLLDIATGREDVHAHLAYSTRSLAADACVAIGARWKLERLMWLACLKGRGGEEMSSGASNEPVCPFNHRHIDLIRPILKFVILLSDPSDDSNRFFEYGDKLTSY